MTAARRPASRSGSTPTLPAFGSRPAAGPRATPTLANGRVYTFGATGIVNALDAASGAVVWTRNATADTGVKVPGWGFSGSPLVVDDAVIIATGGRLVAYDLAKGDRRWLGPEGHGGYSSPQLVTIGGVKQIVLLNPSGATQRCAGRRQCVMEARLAE